MVSDAGSGVDLEYLKELYQRGENEFFREILRQFPAIYEEITSCREMVAEASLRLSRVRKLENAAYGNGYAIDSLTRQNERLSQKVNSLYVAIEPFRAEDYATKSADVPVLTPLDAAIKRRQEFLMAARERDGG